MRRSGSLRASRLDPPTLTTEKEQPVEQAALRSMSKHPSPTCEEHSGSKAAIGQFQASDRRPINAGAYGISRLPVCESLRIVHEGHQAEAPRCLSRGHPAGKEILNIFLFVQRCSLISQLHPHGALGKNCMCETDGFFWKSWDRLWMHGQGRPPALSNALVPVQSLLFLPDPRGAIRQHSLHGAVHDSLQSIKRELLFY